MDGEDVRAGGRGTWPRSASQSRTPHSRLPAPVLSSAPRPRRRRAHTPQRPQRPHPITPERVARRTRYSIWSSGVRWSRSELPTTLAAGPGTPSAQQASSDTSTITPRWSVTASSFSFNETRARRTPPLMACGRVGRRPCGVVGWMRTCQIGQSPRALAGVSKPRHLQKAGRTDRAARAAQERTA